jgi:hypothetical protein
LLGSLILYNLKFRGQSKMIRDALIVVSPLIIITLVFLPSYLGLVNEVKNPQEMLIWENPLNFFSYIGWTNALLFGVSLLYYFLKRKNLDRMDFLVMFWLISLMPILPFYPDRLATYAVVPMCIMVSKFLAETTESKRRVGLLLTLILFIVAFSSYLNWWHVLEGTGPARFDVH